MVRMWCRQVAATLAAGAALGLLLATPVQAQAGARPTGSQARLATLQAIELGGGGGVSCTRLGGWVTYLLAEGTSSRPSAVILLPPNPADVQPGELESLAERFLSAYKLSGYRIASAQNRSAAFLFRNDGPSGGRNRGLQVMGKQGHSLASVVAWLNDVCGGTPHRVEGSLLIWRQMVPVGNHQRELEVALNLLGGMPCYVDVRLRGVNPPAVAELLSSRFKLSLEPVSGSKVSQLRKQLGTKPLGYQEGRKSEGGLAFVRAGGENGFYRLGELGVLAALREQKGAENSLALPRLPEVLWVDDMGSERPLASSPLPPETEPLPGNPAAPAASTSPVPPAAEPQPEKTAPAGMPSPAEAREEYAQRLRAL